MKQSQIKDLIQCLKDKIAQVQTDNSVFESLKNTNDKMNINIEKSKHEIK